MRIAAAPHKVVRPGRCDRCADRSGAPESRVRRVITEQAASHRHAALGGGFAEQRETKTDMAEGPAWIQRFPS